MEVLQNIFGISLLIFIVIGFIGLIAPAFSDFNFKKPKKESKSKFKNIFFKFTNHS